MFAQHNQTTATHRPDPQGQSRQGSHPDPPRVRNGRRPSAVSTAKLPYIIVNAVQDTEQTKRVFLYVVLLPDN